ncbi:transposase [Acetobacter farinalis]|uniref:transposase n=1 Tax=Acetobacter farinalis TaxID=1260984 RepID=UPI00140AB7F5|nr:transposase [Acetobacter farinalis]
MITDVAVSHIPVVGSGTVITRKDIERSSHPGKHRWVAERTFAWISRLRRLTVRYERRVDIHLAFTTIASSPICFRALKTWF